MVRHLRKPLDLLERETGLEPATFCLGIRFRPNPPLSTGVLSCILRGLGLIFGRTEHPRTSWSVASSHATTLKFGKAAGPPLSAKWRAPRFSVCWCFNRRSVPRPPAPGPSD